MDTKITVGTIESSHISPGKSPTLAVDCLQHLRPTYEPLARRLTEFDCRNHIKIRKEKS